MAYFPISLLHFCTSITVTIKLINKFYEKCVQWVSNIKKNKKKMKIIFKQKNCLVPTTGSENLIR